MDRNITTGLIIALILTVAGAFLISSNNGDGGFLLDFLQNSNTSTGDNNSTINNSYINNTNSTINQTTNDTQLNNTNSTITLSFITAAVFDNSTNSSIISIDTSEDNITVDSIVLFTSYNNSNFTEASSLANVTLPTTITVPVNISYPELYYYLEILYDNITYRVPENGSEFINISA